jgi:hypothetical protein
VHRLLGRELLGQRAVLRTRVTNIPVPGIESTPDKIGKTLAA